MSEPEHSLYEDSPISATPLTEEEPHVQSEPIEKLLQKRQSRWNVTIAISVLVLILMIIFSASIGSAKISAWEIILMIGSRIPLVSNFVSASSINPIDQTIFFSIRLPRIIGAILVGAALATSGTVLQDIFSNPLAEPLVVGVSSGAALGAALSIVLGVGGVVFGLNSVIILAFIGGLLSVGVAYGVAGHDPNPNVLLLAGVTMNFLNGAGVSFLTVIAGDKLQALVFWLMGGLGGITWSALAPTAPLMLVGIVALLFFTRDLNILLFGEQQAKGLGVNTARVKAMLIGLTTIITATAVSISGIIGFVGLIIPHIMRLIVGPNHKILLPVSMLMGASFLLFCDTIARVIFLPMEVPVGVITAAAGGPFFMYLLKRQQSHSFILGR